MRNACALLECVAAHQPVGVSELSRLTGIDKSAVQRLAVTLHAAGWLQPHSRPPTRWEISHANPLLRTGATVDLEALARPAMERLRDRSGETVILIVPSGDRLVIAAVVESRQPIRLSPTVGFVLPLEGSSAAAAIDARSPSQEPERDGRRRSGRRRRWPGSRLRSATASAERRAVRTRGYATNDGDVTEGVRAVSSAILDGRTIRSVPSPCAASVDADQDADDRPARSMVAEAAAEVFRKRPETPR